MGETVESLTPPELAAVKGALAFGLAHDPELRDKAAALLASVEKNQQEVESVRKLHAFFAKHALGPLAKPSCLVCGLNDYEEVGIKHLELPGIVVCRKCMTAALTLREKTVEEPQ